MHVAGIFHSVFFLASALFSIITLFKISDMNFCIQLVHMYFSTYNFTLLKIKGTLIRHQILLN